MVFAFVGHCRLGADRRSSRTNFEMLYFGDVYLRAGQRHGRSGDQSRRRHDVRQATRRTGSTCCTPAGRAAWCWRLAVDRACCWAGESTGELARADLAVADGAGADADGRLRSAAGRTAVSVQERVAAGVSYHGHAPRVRLGQRYIVLPADRAASTRFSSCSRTSKPIEHVGDRKPRYAARSLPTVLFGLYVRSFGRPMFVFLLLVMFLLATTELGTDGWISDIMAIVLGSPIKGTLFLVYTSVDHVRAAVLCRADRARISPLGLLAAVGGDRLRWACSGCRTPAPQPSACCFWPPRSTASARPSSGRPRWAWSPSNTRRGGALMLNAIAAVGMLAVGVLGGSGDRHRSGPQLQQILTNATQRLAERSLKASRALRRVSRPSIRKSSAELPPDDQDPVATSSSVQAKQGTLGGSPSCRRSCACATWGCWPTSVRRAATRPRCWPGTRPTTRNSPAALAPVEA